jgi:hypothetical protein
MCARPDNDRQLRSRKEIGLFFLTSAVKNGTQSLVNPFASYKR